MPLVIRDGFTQEDKFPGQHWIEAVSFKYRPALSSRVYEWRAAIAGGGKREFDENVKLLMEHLIEWDIQDERGAMAKIKDKDLYDRIPVPVLDFMCNCIVSYGPRREATDVKNSQPQSE